MTKAKYRLRNWSEYNKSLINRGSINLWIDEDLEKDWFYKKPNKKGENKKLGRSFIYSCKAIELCLIIRSIFRLNLRMTQGFLNSLFPRFNLGEVICPNYSTITKEPVLLIYSTQLKENIEVIGGKNDKQKGINKEAAEWISAAEKLFILGFGFDSNNIDKIGLLKFKGFISKVNSSGGKSTFDRELYYTNLGDHQKIERKISKGLQRIKSTKVIEEALSQDFDLIDN